MADQFKNHKPTLQDPSSTAFSVTTNNTTDFYANTSLTVPRALYVGAAGNVRVQMAGYWNSYANTVSGNTVVTFNNVPAGTILPIRVRKIYASSTANSIIGIL